MVSLAGERCGSTSHRPAGGKRSHTMTWGEARAGPGVQASHGQEV